jgi:HEPN domain-containing protein
MPHDPALVSETRNWLTKAREDLEVADRSLTGGSSPLPSPAAFHSQQAAEKAQKAFLTWHNRNFSKTHDLGELGAECVAIDPALGSLCSSVALVSAYAIAPRYPGSGGEPTIEEAQEAIELAREMYDAVIARLPDDVKP